VVRRLFGVSLRTFFGSVETEGIENVPRQGGGILIAWHPNGVIDGMLLASECPRPLVAGARHGLLHFPVLGWVLRAVGTVPIYRAEDLPDQGEQVRREANTRSLRLLALEVARGSLTALFPEGVSHDEAHPVGLKLGAARLLDMARALRPDAPPPFVLPIGLHYDAKELVRSSALVRFHPPLCLPPELITPEPSELEEARRERLRALTRLFEQSLHEVVHATDDWRIHHLGHRARKLLRAELACRRGSDPGPARLREKRAGFARVWEAARVLSARDPEAVNRITQLVSDYDEVLGTLGLEDHHLDPSESPRLAHLRWQRLARLAAELTLLAPIALVGVAINGPAAFVIGRIAERYGAKVKDRASVKVLAGVIALPLSWAAAGAAIASGAYGLASWSLGGAAAVGMATALAGAAGVPASLRAARLAARLSQAAQVRLARTREPDLVEALRVRRSEIFDTIAALRISRDAPPSTGEDR
jgi:1-acyl-sn-glycerol-3-phosphate acyltransferase